VNSEGVERRLAAILSADVVGYSRLMAEDEAATIRTLTDYREDIAMRVRQHRGRVVDTPGDNLLAEFPTALDAVRCAVETQGVLRALNASLPDERRMDFRIGVHMGDVAAEGDRIYGDGVNIAARLEALAEAGGVCISATVHEQVRNKLDVGFTDLGDQTVKNIPDRVHVYRVQPRSQPAAPARASTSPGERARRLRTVLVAPAAVLLLLALGLWASWPRPLGLAIDLVGLSGPPVNPELPDRPSIVVLPFANVSGNPEQEYFSDGITEELITDLAGVPELFVISRNSAFTYKGQPVKVRDVGRDLGVRYVLEGTVRKVEGRVRITAQLIDATSGFHLWSESYDRELSDILALQSEISQQILVALKVKLRDAALERIARRSSRDLKALDTLWRGVAHSQRDTREGNLEARYLYERAIEQDPDFAVAYAFAGITYWIEYSFGWNLDPALLDRAAEMASRALALDPSTGPAQTVLSVINLGQDRLAEALVAAERAVELAPNTEVPHVVLGLALARQGRFVAAMQSVARAARLNPRAPSGAWIAVAYVNFAAGRTETAVELWEQVRAANPDMIIAHIPLAALYESEGRHEEARALAQEILRVNRDLTAESATELALALGFDTNDAIDNLRRAGLP
jgi:adenylate cyclase